MKLVMIDNYDSFTWNLVQYLGELGATPEVIRNDAESPDAVLDRDPDGIIISPGPCTPTEAGMSVELIRRATGDRPLLGVCLGHQSIGAAFGADIVRAGVIMHGKTSLIHHDGNTIFRGLQNPLTATRYHSLVVERTTFPDCLEISAETPDGVIMGLRHRSCLLEGVQFHPESILTTEGKNLLRNFLELA